MGNKAEKLRDKLVLHRETDCVDIDADIDELVDLSEGAVVEFEEKEDHADALQEVKDEKKELENELDEAKEFSIPAATEWGLLGTQIVEEVEAALKNPKTNQIKFLEFLQGWNRRRN